MKIGIINTTILTFFITYAFMAEMSGCRFYSSDIPDGAKLSGIPVEIACNWKIAL